MAANDPFGGLTVEMREKLERRDHPSRLSPMLATLTHETFSDEGWIFERKFDGERCLAFVHKGEVRLRSRSDKPLNATYPELVDALGKLDVDDLVLDGEVVAFEGSVTSFSRLQNRMQLKDEEEARQSDVAVYYYAFDMPQLEGRSLEKLPLDRRKSLMKSALDYQDPIRFTEHRRGDGEAFHREACRKGWEGVIAKDASSTYAHSRSKKWLKFKCAHQQEFVIVGYTDPEGERIGFGALLIGYYDGDELKYAGKVGTGYDDDFLEDFSGKLEAIERKTPPVDEDELPTGVHWVTPRYVGEVGFTEWTEDHKLRHPRFLGLRRDKQPEEVVREDKS